MPIRYHMFRGEVYISASDLSKEIRKQARAQIGEHDVAGIGQWIEGLERDSLRDFVKGE